MVIAFAESLMELGISRIERRERNQDDKETDLHSRPACRTHLDRWGDRTGVAAQLESDAALVADDLGRMPQRKLPAGTTWKLPEWQLRDPNSTFGNPS